jgi:hypothetical protein
MASGVTELGSVLFRQIAVLPGTSFYQTCTQGFYALLSSNSTFRPKFKGENVYKSTQGIQQDFFLNALAVEASLDIGPARTCQKRNSVRVNLGLDILEQMEAWR